MLAILDHRHVLHMPAGFNSVVAKGVRAPDPSKDKVLKLKGRPVKVPVGPPVPAQQFAQSSLFQVSWQRCESCQPCSEGKSGRLWAPRCLCSSLCTVHSVKYAEGAGKCISQRQSKEVGCKLPCAWPQQARCSFQQVSWQQVSHCSCAGGCLIRALWHPLCLCSCLCIACCNR